MKGTPQGSSHRLISVMLVFSLLINFVLLLREGDTMSSAQCYDMLNNQKKMSIAESSKRATTFECPVCATCPEGTPSTEKQEDDAKEVLETEAPTTSREIGLQFGTELTFSKTDNTVFDPSDKHLVSAKVSRYARSPILKGAMKIRVGPNKWITLDEASFAYDVFFEENQVFQYTSWLGVFCQQDPSDAMAIQDMLWRTKPDLIIEVGTNTGGGAIFYASIMRAYNMKGKIVTLDVKDVSQNWNKKNSHRCVGCITADKHPWWNEGMIHFIKGDITTAAVQQQVEQFVSQANNIFVVEDASHRYPDTLTRMNVIYKYVKVGGYMLVQDTKMDRFVAGLKKRYGNLKFGPMKAVDRFLEANPGWVIDRTYEYLMYSQHHRGFLKRIE